MALSSKLRLRPRASHVTQPPRLPTDLPPRIPNMASNTQLRYLVQHQQHLQEIQQRQEQRHREQESQETKEEIPVEPKDDEEEESRKLLELQLKQQEEELMQRQQIMNWQKELQQQPPKPKAHTPVLLSPTTPLTTIYETVEKSDDDEETLDQSSSLCPKEDRKKNGSNICSHHTRTSESITLNRETPPDLKIQSPVGSPERPPPLEFDWGKKVDIVQQLINQTLLLTGDGCSPLLLLPGGAGGTLSPLESSLWPNLLPPLTPPSATVTSVSSFSPEATGSSAQGEWTVVELETHH